MRFFSIICIYVLKDGEDLAFDDLTPTEQNKVTNQVTSKSYKVNKSLQ